MQQITCRAVVVCAALVTCALAGRIQVACGFNQGSYTVTLNAIDPAASFAPKTFLVNFGRVVGKGSIAVTFATAGLHTI